MAAGATYTPIATYTASAGQTITFSSISQTYTDLVLIGNIGDTTNNGTTLAFNGDTSSNYSRTWMQGNGSTAPSGRNSNAGPLYVTGENLFSPSTVGSEIAIIQIMSYSNSNVYKTFLTTDRVGSSGLMQTVKMWRNTAAITSITLTNSGLAAGSAWTLYGIAAA